MRIILALLGLAILGGCTSSGGRTGPGVIPDDAFGALYTTIPAKQVAACLTEAIGGTMQPNGDRFLVTAPAPPRTTYDVGANDAGGEYPTEVIVRGLQDSLQQRRASICLTTEQRVTRG